MKKIVCYRNDGFVVSNEVYLANTFVDRLVGLMFKPAEKAITLLIKPTQSIHTCFMRFNLDVVFLNQDKKVIKIIKNMKPWRMTGFYYKASMALEIPAGKLPTEIAIGQQLEFKDV